MLFSLMLQANNIKVSNISLTNLNEPNNWVQVEFDLSWENSWRINAGPSNWDAAWVFIKYRSNSGDWQHATLNTANYVAAPGSTVDVTADGMGAFIYRDSEGSGFLNLENIRLRWDYGGLIDTNDVLDVQIFAIEMVYVPQDAFYVGGTNGTENNKFYTGGLATTNIPYQITSENSITVSNTPNNLYYNNTNGNGGDQMGPIPTNFPKGYDAFYCMKYEVSQSQWVSFFNTLTASQKTENDVTGNTGKNTDAEIIRNGISWPDGALNATTAFNDLPLNYVSNTKSLAYLDWAGLRPMTELEFEKACRGPITPKANEFAWGSANISITPYNIINQGEPNELITNIEPGNGNCNYLDTNGTLIGPKRCGILAASSINNTREESGGSYYGIMELSGNVYERCITVGIPQGRIFTAENGDGNISNTGLANVNTWPTTNEGWGFKGGSYTNQSEYLRVSDRNDASNDFSGSNARIGFRGVRSASN
ncbi:hypothetical protein PK35_16340 [Tamlana nanhaiensis]|uniref:Sulfatase-modifying factor enzyme-like domain-containing protein n=1 Tax=Neotamlana nanhaiensis TaxID=1382798 RepID=A0A0D7VW76_9FLAO|nr:hypothetical protein PK35_16340 [Tamlana nanhaiensis]